MAATFLPTTALATMPSGGWNYSSSGGPAGNDGSVIVKFQDGTLTVSGSGAMWDLPGEVGSGGISGGGGNDSTTAPWYYDYDGSNESYRTAITKVVVENGITHIGNKAFRSLDNLTSVELPSSGLLSIGDGAFYDCQKLTEITIPDSVTTIGASAFYNCHVLALVKGGAGVTTIKESAFEGVSSPLLVPDALFDNLVGADRCAFNTILGYEDNTSGVTITKVHVNGSGEDIEIPGTVGGKAVTAIGDSAFADAGASQWAVHSVTLPDSVASIGDNAFKGCNSMETIRLSSGLKTIGASAFEGCTQLTGVTLPSGLTTIGAKAFMDCYSIDGLEIPSTVTTIGDDAFKGYRNGMFIVPDALKDQMACTNAPSGDKTYPNMIAYAVNGNNVTLTKLIAYLDTSTLTLPNEIGGKTVTAIGNDFGVDRDENGNTSAPVGGIKTIVLPAGVTSIGKSTFEGWYDLERITGLEKVTSIGDSAFAHTGLKSVTLPNALTAIPAHAFEWCENLTSITIPENVTSIGENAFSDTAITSITIPKKVTTIDPNAFIGCDALTTIVNLGTYTGQISTGGDSLNTVVWPDGGEYHSVGKVTFFYTRNAANSDDVTITGVETRGQDVTSAVFPAGTGLNVTMVLIQSYEPNAITVTGVNAPQFIWNPTRIDEGEHFAEITKIVPVNGAKAALPETVTGMVYDDEDGEMQTKTIPVMFVEEAYRQYADHTGRDHVYVDHGEGICQLCGEKANHTHEYEWAQEVHSHYKVCTVCKAEDPDSYGEHTYENGVCKECGLKKPVLDSIAVPRYSSVRTKYLVGQNFDPTELYLECTYTVEGSDSMEEGVGYRSGTASRFSFEPGLDTALSANNNKVTVSYTEDGVTKTVDIAITVTEGTPVTGVTLDRTTATMKVGEELTLTATVTPEDATIQDVEWDTSDYGIARILRSTNPDLVRAAGAATATITARAAGTVTITATTVDGGKTATCVVTVTGGDTPVDPVDPNPGGGSSSGGGSSTTTETTTNPDGSTTTKTEDKTTGTVTETTKNTDGSQTVVETKKDGTVTTTETDATGNKTETVANPDGSSVVTVEQKDGTAATVNTDTAGKVEAEVALPKEVVAAAQEGSSAIMLPIPEIQAAAGTEAAPVVTVKTGSDEPVKVLIPTTEVNPGTVAVIVKEDGTEEIVKTSVSTEDGLAVALPDGATVKIVDNSKTFADVPADNWVADAVSFSSARELFSGTSENTFSPNEPMTRAMMVTVLARFDGADTNGGGTWYEKGAQWAADKGISDGSNLGSSVSREQLAVMLWRYAGSPAPTGNLDDFHDAGSVSDYAQDAMRWAVENGIIKGNGSGGLLPQGDATRAQVAQMLKNFISAQ